MNSIGIVLAAKGGAIVTVAHEEDGLLVTDIERLPFDFSAIADRVLELDTEESPETRFRIDAEGLGGALWDAPPRKTGTVQRFRWTLHAARGLERQALVDVLVLAIHDNRLHFAPGLDEQAAMSAALVGYRRQVREDGLIGSELVVALCLAAMPPRTTVRGGYAFIS